MKKIVLLVIIIVLALLGYAYWKGYWKPSAPYQLQLPPKTEQPGAQKPQARRVYTVQLNDSGPSPKSLEIASGDTVKFVNTGTRPYWMASGIHPTHNLCPGFDAVHSLVHNEEYSYTFNFEAPKICPYHNHVDPTSDMIKGTINIVK